MYVECRWYLVVQYNQVPVEKVGAKLSWHDSELRARRFTTTPYFTSDSSNDKVHGPSQAQLLHPPSRLANCDWDIVILRSIFLCVRRWTQRLYYLRVELHE